MQISRIVWDLDDDPDGNVQHIAEHGISTEEVEDVLYAATEVVASESSGRPTTFGETSAGKYIAVVLKSSTRICWPYIPSLHTKRNPETSLLLPCTSV